MRFAGSALGGGFADYLANNNSTFGSGKISDMNTRARSQERNAVTRAESQTHQFGLKALGTVKAAEYEAEAIRARGAAQGQMAMADGLGSLASGIAGGISSMPTGGGFSSGSGGMGFPSVGTGNYFYRGPGGGIFNNPT